MDEDTRDQRRMYNDLAWTWPIISPPEDYVEESEIFSDIIKRHSRIPPRTLLHVGCGGGHNDYTFKRHFEVYGVDISPEMLELAKRLNPDVTYSLGDMRSVRLGKVFDAVAILDSINYMSTLESLRAAFRTAHAHLRRGGVLIAAIEETVEDFRQNETSITKKSRDGVEVTLIENGYDPDKSDTSYEATFVYLIKRGEALDIQVDRHVCGIFDLDTWFEIPRNIGMEATLEKVTFSGTGEDRDYRILACVKA